MPTTGQVAPIHNLEQNSSNEKIEAKHDELFNSANTDADNVAIKWTFTRVIAVAALCIAYVGMFSSVHV